MLGLKTKALIAVGFSAALVGAGWQARSWYEDSQDLTAEKAKQAVLDAVRQEVATIGERVEKTLEEGRVNERVIDRGIIRETEKTVYRDRECFGPELVRLLNLGAKGAAADLSGELTEEVPGDASGTD